MPRTAAVSCLAVAAALACDRPADPAPPPAPDWPEGTVLVVDDEPILAEDVAPWAEDVALLYPEYSPIHCRRLALTNVLLPLAALRRDRAEAREEARRACVSARERIGELADSAVALEGTWRRLGFDLWSFARDLAPGAWSEPTELPGRWILVRLTSAEPGRAPQEEILTLQRLEFAYVDPEEPGKELRAAVDSSTLVVVDPEWGEAVPESWKHRMRGEPR